MHHIGYEVWITCDGQRLPEYSTQVEEADKKTIACFIPSESGKTFAINWRDRNVLHHLTLYFKIDGKPLGHGMTCVPGSTGKRSGLWVGVNEERPFQFADLKTSDDDALLDGLRQGQNEHLGSIEIAFIRVHANAKLVPYQPEEFNPVGAVHERSKKAGAHSVSLGQVNRVDRVRPMYLSQTVAINPMEKHTAMFIFRYRPRALLQAQGLMPPQPEPEAGPSGEDQRGKKRPGPERQSDAKRPKVEPGAVKVDRGVIDLSDDDVDEDVKELQRQLRIIQDKIDRSKKNRVKEEPAASTSHGKCEDDVIDLTLDD